MMCREIDAPTRPARSPSSRGDVIENVVSAPASRMISASFGA